MEKKIYDLLVQVKGFEHIIETDLLVKHNLTNIITVKPYDAKVEKEFAGWVEFNNRDWSFPTEADIQELLNHQNIEVKLGKSIKANPVIISESKLETEFVPLNVDVDLIEKDSSVIVVPQKTQLPTVKRGPKKKK